jgi:SAM-dependent methyltransferase
MVRLEDEAAPLMVWLAGQSRPDFVDEAGLASILDGQIAREERPHSEKELGEFREFWWNADQLRLLSERLGVAAVESFVDIGCGGGYWSSLMLSLMAEPRRVIGIDQEPQWIEQARTRLGAAIAEKAGCELELLLADAHHLPVESESLDMATCQAVLMHVRNPAQVLSEMIRVVRPGGLVLCVEPDRLLNYVPTDSIALGWSPEEHGELWMFWHYCRLGRVRCGEGDLAMGARLAELLVEQGLEHVQVFLRDKVFPITPPYDSEENRRWFRELFNSDGSQNLFEPDRLVEWARAGGATEEFARRQVSRLLGWLDEMRSEVADNKYASPGGGVMYVVAARKPR